jgi:hypothetical protein
MPITGWDHIQNPGGYDRSDGKWRVFKYWSTHWKWPFQYAIEIEMSQGIISAGSSTSAHGGSFHLITFLSLKYDIHCLWQPAIVCKYFMIYLPQFLTELCKIPHRSKNETIFWIERDSTVYLREAPKQKQRRKQSVTVFPSSRQAVVELRHNRNIIIYCMRRDSRRSDIYNVLARNGNTGAKIAHARVARLSH